MLKSFFVFCFTFYASIAHATTLTPVDKTNPIKVIGHWRQYNIYDVDPSDLGLNIGPFHFSGQHFESDLDVADAMTPIDAADINKNGVRCEFLCVNPMNQVIGFNPKMYAVSYRIMHQSR